MFNGAKITSQKLCKTIEEAKNDAAEFALTQIFPNQIGPNGEFNINEIYFNYLQQKSLNQSIAPTQQQQILTTSRQILNPVTSPVPLIYTTNEQTIQTAGTENSSSSSTNININQSALISNETYLKQNGAQSWHYTTTPTNTATSSQPLQQHAVISPEFFQTMVAPQYITIDPASGYLPYYSI